MSGDRRSDRSLLPRGAAKSAARRRIFAWTSPIVLMAALAAGVSYVAIKDPADLSFEEAIAAVEAAVDRRVAASRLMSLAQRAIDAIDRAADLDAENADFYETLKRTIRRQLDDGD